jgi:Leucine-rich repeat (LRR) protein
MFNLLFYRKNRLVFSFFVSELGTALSNCKLLVKLVAYENKIDKISPFNHTMLRELWLNGNHIRYFDSDRYGFLFQL